MKAMSLVELDAVPIAPNSVLLDNAFTVNTDSGDKLLSPGLSKQ